MGRWAELAKIQEEKAEPLTVTGALTLVAFWRARRFRRPENLDWVPLVKHILRKGGKSKTRETVAPLLILLAKEKNATVPSAIRAEVFNYVNKSAAIMDKRAPDARIPTFDAQENRFNVERMIRQLGKTALRTKKKFGIGALILLALIASETR